MKRFFQSNWPYLVLVAAIAAIFSPAWGIYTLLIGPDSPLVDMAHHARRLNEAVSGMSGLDFHDVLELMLPPYLFNDLTYQMDVLIAALGLGWLLRTRGAENAAAAFGGLCFALMGYSLTLVAAGHRGFFFMTAYAMLAFAFMARGVAGRGAANWALAGCCGAWALRRQPDFAAIYLITAAIYGVHLTIRRLRADGHCGRIAARTALGVAIAAATFAISAIPAFRGSLGAILSERSQTLDIADAQAGGGTAASSEAGAPDGSWIFTTNWSLPPDEALEFVAPAIKGRQTGDPVSPYWGRLGRTWKWEETHEGFVNFRQHVVYLGAIPLALALLAAIWAFLPGAGRSGAQGGAYAELRHDVRFWGVVWLVALLLCFGRYTPFYRLFHALPYVSMMRAPVKFVRLLEFSTAFMAAAGVCVAACHEPPRGLLRRLSSALLALAAAFLAFACAVSASPGLYTAPLAELGAGPALVSAMARNASLALLHATVGFGIAGCVLRLRSLERPVLPGMAAIAILSVSVAVDATTVARPYMFARDMRHKYAPSNGVTASILKATPARMKPAVWLTLPDAAYSQAVRDNLEYFGVEVHPRTDLAHARFAAAAGPDAPYRIMELTGCSFAIVPADQARALPRGRFSPEFGFARRSPPALAERTMAPGPDGAVAMRVTGAIPDGAFFADWADSSEEDLLPNLARWTSGPRGAWRLPVVGCDVAPPGGAATNFSATAEFTSTLGRNGARATRLSINAPAPGMVLLHMAHDAKTAATVDGKPARIFTAGYKESAIHVEGGSHEIVVTNVARLPAWPAVQWAVLALAGLGIACEACGRGA